MITYLWVPILIVFYIGHAWLSLKNNQEDGWLIWLLLYNALPAWVVISKISKRILFDGMLYDNIMFLTYVFTIAYLDKSIKSFSCCQWLGFMLVMAGSIMMRLNFRDLLAT